jgi:hypothetical protein
MFYVFITLKDNKHIKDAYPSEVQTKQALALIHDKMSEMPAKTHILMPSGKASFATSEFVRAEILQD